MNKQEKSQKKMFKEHIQIMAHSHLHTQKFPQTGNHNIYAKDL